MASSEGGNARGLVRTATLRTQFLLIVICSALIPLSLVSLWLTSSAVRSGEQLLAHHLDESANHFVSAINARWEHRRGNLYLLADNTVTRDVIARGSLTDFDRQFLTDAMQEISETVPSVELVDKNGIILWNSAAETSSRPPQADTTRDGLPRPAFLVSIPIPPDSAQVSLGYVRASLRLSDLFSPDSAQPVIPGGRLGIRDVRSGQVLIRIDRDVPFVETARVSIAGATWLTSRRMSDAGLEIALAAPLAPYVNPLRDAGRVGVLMLLAVASVALLSTIVLMSRVTRPLSELADAADAVAKGQLDAQVSGGGPAEVRKVGSAFNLMVGSLRSTLEKLAQRNAMAAVGEFATSLSHDVRNALTSIKVDVERVAHRPMDQASSAAVLQRVLNNVARLDSLVSGALRLARGERATRVELDIRQPVYAAAEIVAGAFASVPANLSVDTEGDALVVNGDSAALEQLLANVLFNSAQAVRPGGATRIRVFRENGFVAVEVADDGIGMNAEQVAQLRQPFTSSKSSGTGLGLPIAHQIAAAHAGELSVISESGYGTRVTLRLPSA